MIQFGFPLMNLLWIAPDYQKETSTPDLGPQNWSIFETFLLPLNWFNPQSEGLQKKFFPCLHYQVTDRAGKVQLQLWPCGQARNLPVTFHLLPGNGNCRLSQQHFLERGFNPGSLGWISSQAGRAQSPHSPSPREWWRDSHATRAVRTGQHPGVVRKRPGDRAGIFKLIRYNGPKQ